MKLHIVPARTGLEWVRLGIRVFWRQPMALAALFFMTMAAILAGMGAYLCYQDLGYPLAVDFQYALATLAFIGSVAALLPSRHGQPTLPAPSSPQQK